MELPYTRLLSRIPEASDATEHRTFKLSNETSPFHSHQSVVTEALQPRDVEHIEYLQSNRLNHRWLSLYFYTDISFCMDQA